MFYWMNQRRFLCQLPEQWTWNSGHVCVHFWLRSGNVEFLFFSRCISSKKSYHFTNEFLNFFYRSIGILFPVFTYSSWEVDHRFPYLLKGFRFNILSRLTRINSWSRFIGLSIYNFLTIIQLNWLRHIFAHPYLIISPICWFFYAVTLLRLNCQGVA